MISATVNAFLTKEPEFNDKRKCYKFSCGTKVGYNSDKKEDVLNWLTVSVYDESLFNKVKTLKKGSSVLLVGTLYQYEFVSEGEKNKILLFKATEVEYLNTGKKDEDKVNPNDKSATNSKGNSSKSGSQKSNGKIVNEETNNNNDDGDDLPF